MQLLYIAKTPIEKKIVSLQVNRLQMTRFSSGKKIALLIDPDKITEDYLNSLISTSEKAKVDFFLVGSSILLRNSVAFVVKFIKKCSSIPVYLFPGSVMQICDEADGILLLSLLSGRNPELLIGQHVLAAPALKAAQFDIVSTGYILIDGGIRSSVEYMSNTQPIPANKSDIAACTAMAGEQLGMQSIYLEAGSGAIHPVSISLIAEVRKATSVPIWVGGGIKTSESARNACIAGADIIVVGTAFEQDLNLIAPIAEAIHQLNN